MTDRGCWLGQPTQLDPTLSYEVDHMAYVADRHKMLKSKVDPICKG